MRLRAKERLARLLVGLSSLFGLGLGAARQAPGPDVIAKAWRDPVYFSKLAPELRAKIPPNPAGTVQLQWHHGNLPVTFAQGTTSADCNTMSSDCNTMSSDCNTMSSDCNTMSSNCNTMSSSCNTMSSDCNTMASDCNTMSSDCGAPHHTHTAECDLG